MPAALSPLSLQVKLLRVLQECNVCPFGSDHAIDVRILNIVSLICRPCMNMPRTCPRWRGIYYVWRHSAINSSYAVFRRCHETTSGHRLSN
ncbi:MAG: hypothetical protein GPOALKHO_000130 [Sodalis sp.]|nr:MAG: hypothetical protein GPOALKHO_000130 [Sodalis sp.]